MRTRAERERNDYAKLSLEYGRKLTCWEDVDAYLAEILHKHECCTLCGLHIPSDKNRRIHKNNQRCLKRQAKQKNVAFVPKRQQTKHCEICNKPIRYYRWKTHIESMMHKETARTRILLHGLCSGSRAKRMMKRHLETGKKHHANLKKPGMNFVHNALWRKYFPNLKSILKESGPNPDNQNSSL